MIHLLFTLSVLIIAMSKQEVTNGNCTVASVLDIIDYIDCSN